jgi:hypothetical protein
MFPVTLQLLRCSVEARQRTAQNPDYGFRPARRQTRRGEIEVFDPRPRRPPRRWHSREYWGHPRRMSNGWEYSGGWVRRCASAAGGRRSWPAMAAGAAPAVAVGGRRPLRCPVVVASDRGGRPSCGPRRTATPPHGPSAPEPETCQMITTCTLGSVRSLDPAVAGWLCNAGPAIQSVAIHLDCMTMRPSDPWTPPWSAQGSLGAHLAGTSADRARGCGTKADSTPRAARTPRR